MDNNINLLKTKFSINHIYELKAVARNRLFEILDDSVNSRVTFISAPAGFGKTTLLSSWIIMRKKRSIRAAWLTLDEEDNDDTRFWTYFVSAIENVVPEALEKSLNLLKSSRIGGMETVITVLINEIQDVKKEILFIIEDLHVIKNKEILSCLKYFIKHMPYNVHLIITSRRGRTSLIPGVKACKGIIEINEEDLRFTKDEASFFINETMKLETSEDETKRLYELTEGWPAGLQIAALSCKRNGIDVIKDKNKLLHTQLSNYFMEDVLNSQPPDIYEFLIKTSLLDTFSYELCLYVTGMPDCKNILSKVFEMNLFISCSEGKENWYRYHNLFTEFLKKRIEKEQPNLISEIYLKAGQWYESKGYKQEAGSYYLKGKNYRKAAALIEETSTSLIYQGSFSMLEKWIEAVPANYLYESPRLMLDYVWVHLSKYKIDAAKYYIEMIEKEFGSTKQLTEPAFEGEFLIAKAFVSMDHLNESIELLKKSMELTDTYDLNYPAALMSIATSYIIHGEISDAEEYYSKALISSKKIGNLYSAAYSLGSLGMMMTCQGRLTEAEALYKEAEEYLKEKGGKYIPLLGIVFSGLSEIYYVTNQIEKAYELSVKAVDFFENGGIFDIKNNCYVIKSRALLAKGNKSGAIQTMKKAMILSQGDKIYGFKRHIDYCMARMFLDMDDLDRAEVFVEQYNLSFEENIKKYNLHDYVLLAEILVKRGKFKEALCCIENIMKSGSAGSMYEVELRIIKADALLCISKPEEAYHELNKALSDCTKENYTRIFINYGNRMKEILNEFMNNGKGRYEGRNMDYAEHILNSFQVKPVKAVKEEAVLTRRELEVLKLVSEGASNDEIAKAMFISVSTVKSHILNIFGKLEVKNRSKAAFEAEKRGLI